MTPPSGAARTPGAMKISEEMKHLLGKTLGGFQLLDLIGAGGMGAVFLARQISLDREVALKILPDRFANNAEAMARFTREALSAAQMTHHNVVQVYDVGSDEGHHFISMEYVRGRSLGDLIRKEGRLQVDDAAGYVLQTARGLLYAHEQGIIHRDIKPDNLLLNEHGVVKIADMGLAKSVKDFDATDGEAPTVADLQEADPALTMANRGMGTPAYMPPEQARDAASVDARADQYSLGCTLYYLCAGKAPYSGTTAFELITKHLKEPLTPLDAHVRDVPPSIESIIERMLAKDADDRYPDLAPVCKELETHLGVESDKGPYRPREHHVAALEKSLAHYYGAPTARARKWVGLAFVSLASLLMVIALLGGNLLMAGGYLGLMVLTPLFNFVLHGVLTKAYLFRRVRSLFFGMSLKSWAKLIGATALAAAVLWFFGWLWMWIAFAVVAIGMASANQFFLARRMRADRVAPLELMHKTLRELRLRGVSEEALHEFVCRFSGTHWEELFENLFGYEAMISARNRWAVIDHTTPRKRFETWRDPVARWLDRVEETRKVAREQRALAKAEARRLRAQGVSEAEAERKASEEASRFLAAEKRKAEKALHRQAKRAKAEAAVRIPKERSRISIVFSLIRAALGLAILAAWGTQFDQEISLPTLVDHWLRRYLELGIGQTPYAAGAGAILLISALSGRLFGPAITTVGALLMVTCPRAIEVVNQPQLSLHVAQLGATGVALGGLGLCVLAKLGGGRF